MKTVMLGAALALAGAAGAGTPFAANLAGLEALAVTVNGDPGPAKKAGYPHEAIRKDLKAALSRAGLKVGASHRDVAGAKRALQMELMLGIVNKERMYSYSMTLQAYEPMRIDGKDRLYVAWTGSLFGFGTQETVKGQIREQVDALAALFIADWKAAGRGRRR